MKAKNVKVLHASELAFLTLAVLSMDPVAMSLSLGETVIELMSLSWAFSVSSAVRLTADEDSESRSSGTVHTLMVQSTLPLTTWPELKLK